jgi:hypothetical protein
MSLLPEDASFEELVQDCFLAYRGTGLMLSPLDAALVTEWHEKGVPFEVVARGIRKAAEKALVDAPKGQTGLRSLRAAARSVDAEMRHHLARAVGVGQAPHVAETPMTFDVSHHQKVTRAVKALAEKRPDLARVTEEMLSGILARPPAEPGDASRRGDVVTVTLLRAMAFEERLPLLKDAHARVGAVRMSARARRMSRRFHRAQVLTAHLGLPALG